MHGGDMRRSLEPPIGEQRDAFQSELSSLLSRLGEASRAEGESRHAYAERLVAGLGECEIDVAAWHELTPSRLMQNPSWPRSGLAGWDARSGERRVLDRTQASRDKAARPPSRCPCGFRRYGPV